MNHPTAAPRTGRWARLAATAGLAAALAIGAPAAAQAEEALPTDGQAPQTVQAPDTEAMVLNTVCTRLEDTVRSALAENGIAYTEVDVALDADSETVEVADVTVIVPGGTDVSGVEDVVTKALGTHVPVTVNEEG